MLTKRQPMWYSIAVDKKSTNPLMKGDETMTNSKKLKGAIISSGLTQAEVADKMGISATAFSYKVTNKSRFTAEEIVFLRKLLNLSRDEVDDIFFAER